jgi:hypothetical protein
MTKSKWPRRIWHLLGLLYIVIVLFEVTVVPFGGFLVRKFRRVEILAVDGPYAGGRVFVKVQPGHTGNRATATLPVSDMDALRPGELVWLMTADWNIKGPEEQRVTLWRMFTAYHFFLVVVYPLWLASMALKKILSLFGR